MFNAEERVFLSMTAWAGEQISKKSRNAVRKTNLFIFVSSHSRATIGSPMRKDCIHDNKKIGNKLSKASEN